MKGREFDRMLDVLGFEVIQEAADFFEVDRRTITRWIADELAIPASVEKLGMTMVAIGLSPERVDQIAKSDALSIAIEVWCRTRAAEEAKILEQANAYEDPRARALFLRGAGYSFEAIGKELGLSRQRVHKMLEE